MNLYHWANSTALRRYSDGDIFVVAENLAQARETALANWDSYATEHLWLDSTDEYDAKELFDLRAKLVDDLSIPPTEVRTTPCVAFIQGSD